MEQLKGGVNYFNFWANYPFKSPHL